MASVYALVRAHERRELARRNLEHAEAVVRAAEQELRNALTARPALRVLRVVRSRDVTAPN